VAARGFALRLPRGLLREQLLELGDELGFVVAGVGAREEAVERFAEETFPGLVFAARVDGVEERAVRARGGEVAGVGRAATGAE
jgi:hypothetical protein